ncbi:MAG TPA: lamin tail domain-containing protein, partial [Planctomycetota bacterium]|nr:lamin tail domain-containing protein [Planctomycetota bacterium]
MHGGVGGVSSPVRAALGLLGMLWVAVIAHRGASAAEVVLSEIHYHPPDADARGVEFVELHNTTGAAVALGGWRLDRGIRFTVPNGFVLAPGGRVVVAGDPALLRERFGTPADAVLGPFEGSLDNAGEEIELLDASGAHVDGVVYGDKLPWPEAADGEGSSLQRICASSPSIDALNWSADFPTPAEPSADARCPPPAYVTPRVVITEIHYHPDPGPGPRPATEDGEEEEFIELHNPGAAPVDMSGWKLAFGIDLTFPAGTVLEPLGYLVVARDEATLRSRYAIPNLLAINFEGRLANSGERVGLLDQRGEIVDSVEYSDGGDWPYTADGLGRSLEKVVATLSGNDPANWQASTVVKGTYRQLVGDGPVGQGLTQKLILSIDGPGEALIDNIRFEDVTDPESPQLILEESFDVNIDGWTPAGNAAGSRHASGAGVGGTGALRLVSSSSCPSSECGTANSVSRTVAVGNRRGTFRVTLDFQYVSGSPFFRGGLYRGAGVTVRQLSTPGRPNSAAAADLPIVITNVNRFPLEPTSGDAVSITARVRSTTPAVVNLVYDDGLPGGEVTLPMFDDGQHGDHLAGDGVFGVELPAFPHSTKVIYRLSATAGARSAESPVAENAGVRLRHEYWGYYVDDSQLQPALRTSLPLYHIVLDQIQGSDWRDINDLLGDSCSITVPADFASEGTLYPGVSLRFRGNTACVIKKRNFKLTFNRGRFFRGLRKMNLNSEWTDKALVREHLAWDFMREIGAPHCETEFTRVHVNGDYLGLYLYVEHPDSRFLDRNGLDSGSKLYKSKQPFVGGDRPIGVALQARVQDYPAFWEEETLEGGDFTDIAEFIGAMHADGGSGRPTADFWAFRSMEEAIIRYQVGQVVLDNVDSFAKNHFLYHDLPSNRWAFITWDLDLTFGKFFNPNAVGVGREVGTLNDLMHSDLAFDLNPWFGATVLGNILYNWLIDFFFRADRDYYQRAYLIRLWDILQEKYRNDIYDPRLDDLAIRLGGEAALDLQLWDRYPSNVPGFPRDFLPNIEIMKEQIRLHRDFLLAYMNAFHPTIANHPRVKITEVMYLPEDGDDDLEFLELLNTHDSMVDLSGWSIPGIGYMFPSGSEVPAGAVFLVARSPAKLRARYSDRTLQFVFGPYPGKLANEGE